MGAQDARVRHEEVQAAECGVGALEVRLHLVLAGNVNRAANRLDVVGGREPLGERLTRVSLNVADSDVGALSGQSLRDGFTQALGATGHDGLPALQDPAPRHCASPP